MTDYDTADQKPAVPSGAARLGTDSNGNDHYYAPAIKDKRVFIVDGETVAEVHDLDELAAAGAINEPTPRAWLDAWNNRVGVETDRVGMSALEQLTDAFEEATA